MSTVEEIIALGWRGQAKGNRATLEERYETLSTYINEWMPTLNQERHRLSTAPITEQLSQRKMDYAFASNKLDRAIDAHRVIDAELKRRGGRND